jgi:hypothetical protein
MTSISILANDLMGRLLEISMPDGESNLSEGSTVWSHNRQSEVDTPTIIMVV